MNPTKQLKPDREQILFLTFIFRAIPRRYFLPIFPDKEPKRSREIGDAIYSLIKLNYLTCTKSLTGDLILYLSIKGYKYINERIIRGLKPQYNYMTSRTRRVPTNIHEYMNFQFLRRYVAKNWNEFITKDVSIYTDADVNACKIKFPSQGKDLDFRPDILIEHRENEKVVKQILIENDRGTENTIQIYRKFI